MLIGDSIRLEYQPGVAERLADTAEVSGPAENCGDSENLLRRLDGWVDSTAALVVLNAGLHDVRRSRADGRCQVEIARYEENLTDVIRALRGSGAAILFATTTPVHDERHAASGKAERLDADVLRYNEAARRVMEALEVPVLDLHALVAADPALLAADGVHLTPAGNDLVADAVAGTIVDLL